MALNKQQIEKLLSLSVNDRKDWLQRDFLREWKINHCRGTFEGATGVGKTRTAVLAVMEEIDKNPHSVIYIMVPTETLRDVDWPDEFRKWGAENYLQFVKIMCHTSMSKAHSRTGEVDLVILDEFHHITPKQAAFFDNNKVYKSLGLSATLPKGTKSEEDLIKKQLVDQYCPSIYKISLEEAIELKIIADFEVKVLMFKLDDVKVYNYGTEQKKQLRTELGQYKHLSKQLGKAMYNKKFEGLKFQAMQRRKEFLVNSKSKLALAKTCLAKMIEPGKRTLVFCGSIAQSVELLGTNVYNSKSNDLALKAFQAEEISELGAVDALDEGKNINLLDQILIVQGTSVARRVVQRFGRMLRIRPNHKGLAVVLVAKDTADEKWYHEAYADIDKSRIKVYNVKTEL